MTTAARVRRLLVTIGVAGSLVAAGVTIRAASMWASVDAPLTVAPVSVTSVQEALDQERLRVMALEEQLAGIGSSAADLRAALDAAQGQVVTDRATADELRASLAAAQQKLASLRDALRLAARRGTATSPGGTGPTGSVGGDDDGGEHDD